MRTTCDFLLCWLTKQTSAAKRLSATYRSDRILLNFWINFILCNINWLLFQAYETKNTSTAESRWTLYATHRTCNMPRILTIVSLYLIITLNSCYSIEEPHSLNYKPQFDDLAEEIIAQPNIFEMDDFTRHYKSLNGTFIYLGNTPDPSDILGCKGSNNCPQSLERTIDSFQIDLTVFSSIQEKLRKTKLRYFYKSGHTVLFIVDGFLDDSWGFLYDSKGINKSDKDFLHGKYSIHLLDSINPKWRRVSIGH